MTTYNPIPHCTPGNHVEEFTYRFKVLRFCVPDYHPAPVTPFWWWATTLAVVGLIAFFVYLVYLMIFDRQRP